MIRNSSLIEQYNASESDLERLFYISLKLFRFYANLFLITDYQRTTTLSNWIGWDNAIDLDKDFKHWKDTGKTLFTMTFEDMVSSGKFEIVRRTARFYEIMQIIANEILLFDIEFNFDEIMDFMYSLIPLKYEKIRYIYCIDKNNYSLTKAQIK